MTHKIKLSPKVLASIGFKELMYESDVSASRFGRKSIPSGVWQFGFGSFDSVSYVPASCFLRIKFMHGCSYDYFNIKFVHELQLILSLHEVCIKF